MDDQSENVPEKNRTGTETGPAPPPVPENLGAGTGLHEVVWAHMRLFARRIVRSNFLAGGVSDEEKRALEEAGVTTPMSQNYLAWRRALLWFGAVSLGVALVIGVFSRFSGMGQFPGFFQFVWVLVFLAEVGACALGIFAALTWTDIGKTRQLARFSWFCVFLVPLVLYMIPIVPFMDQSRFAFNPQGAMQTRMMFGGMYFILLAPKLIGFFPAVIRSSLTLKTLLPESPMPGWIAVVVAPLYALFFIVLLVIAMQVGDFLLILSMTALAAAPVMIVLGVNRLVQPCSEDEALENIRHVRKRIGIANLVGLIAGVLYGFQMIKQIGVIDLIQFVGTIFAAVFLLTVVASDLLIGVFKTAFLRENALREGPLAGELGKRFEDLDSRGLTDLLAGEAELFRSVKKKFSSGGDGGDKEAGSTDEEKRE